MFCSMLLLLALPFADGYGWAGRSCQEFLVDGGTVEKVCTDHAIYGPMLASEHRSSDVFGDYADVYEIIEPPEDSNASDYLTSGVTIHVKIYSEGGCIVKINGTKCAACETCGADARAVSVDCSVVPDGRVVECESLENVFLPLQHFTSTQGKVSDNQPTAESLEGSASSTQPMTLLVASGVVAVATMILHL